MKSAKKMKKGCTHMKDELKEFLGSIASDMKITELSKTKKFDLK